MKPTTRALLSSAAALTLTLAALAAPGATFAAEPESQITSPTGTIYPLVTAVEGPQIKVEGTANFAEATIRCYYGGANSDYQQLVERVTVSDGRFSAGFPVRALSATLLCRMRAVPFGEHPLEPPKQDGPFNGPLVASSDYEPGTEDYFLASGALGGGFDFESAEDCGLEDSFLYGPLSLEASAPLFSCAGEVADEDGTLKVDGDYAYGPLQAREVNENVGGKVKDLPALAVSQSFDESAGQIAIHEQDPIVTCSPEPATAPSEATCREFVATGVTLERTWTTGADGRVASLRDAWKSTDGRAHTVSLLYSNTLAGAGGASEGVYELPGSDTFTATESGAHIAVPDGVPGTILYKTDSQTPEGGEGEEHPQGAVVYDRSPGSLAFEEGTDEEVKYSIFEMPFSLSVPAGGESVLRMAFVQAFALPEVRTLAAAAVSGFAPAIAISSPAAGTVTTSPTAVVTGTASDSGAIAAVEVNGVAAQVSGSSWSANVPLSAGANTVTATVTDDAGLTASASETLTDAGPQKPAPPTQKPAANEPSATRVGPVKGADGEIVFTLACSGASCAVKSSASVTEHLSGGKLESLTAKSKRATVASGALTIAAGKTLTVTLKLNATGRKLLARFHKLPVRLIVTLAGSTKDVIDQTLTITAPQKKHKG